MLLGRIGTMNITDWFLNSIEQTVRLSIPTPVMEKAHLSLLDYIAVTTAGAKANENKLREYLNAAEPEYGVLKAVGMNMSTNLKEATFLNGLNAHALDFDDGSNEGIIHLGSPIFSVLIPLAQRYHCTVKELLHAVIIGYETAFTIAVSIQPNHKALGYHATGTCGILGIAVAASYLLGYSQDQRRNAFAIAAVSATGMLKVLDDGSELKPYNVAKSALLGLTAVQMAKAGFVGNADVLGGDRGFLKMMAGDETIKLKEPLLRGTWAIEKTYTKPYAACRYCHPAIEASIRMRDKVVVESIESISVSTYAIAIPNHDHTEIMGKNSAKMSIPYGVSVGLIEGKAGLREYDEPYIYDSDILALTKKIKVFDDVELSNQFPRTTSAIVDVKMKSGESFSERVDYPKGEPGNPMTKEEFNVRYFELMEYGDRTKEESKNIIELCNTQSLDVALLCEMI